MPIVMSKEEWERLTRWTEHDREDPEVVRRREYVRYLDATSNEMTKNWPNSVENVNKRNEELRRARLEAAEQTNSRFYKRYLKRKKEEQERLMYSARDIIFKNKDAPRLLLSAVLETCTQAERLAQVQFLEDQRRQEAEQKRKDDDEIIRKAKEWEQLLLTKKKRRFDANKKHQKEILDQAQEISERNRKAYEEELDMQKLDNIRAEQQMDAIKEFEENFQKQEKARILGDMKQAKKELDERRAEQAARDKMDDRLIDVLLQSKQRINKKRKETEKAVKAARQAILDNISSKLKSGDAARDAKEQAILEKAIKEKEDIAAMNREAQSKRAAAARKERTEMREKWLRDEQQRIHEYNNMQHWECMNRFKNIELYEDFKEELRKENERKIKEFREDTLRLWKERDDREAQERAETRYFYGELAEQKIRDADNKLLAHAAELLQEARDNGRPEYALHEAIDRYCKLNRLYPMPELPKTVASHFKRYAPRDGSKPDPQYRLPMPPVHKPDTFDDQASTIALETGGTGRNGLNDPNELPATSTNNKKEETVEDYKRVGRADGLQRRHGQHDINLPPITVIPCPSADCSCGLNK